MLKPMGTNPLHKKIFFGLTPFLTLEKTPAFLLCCQGREDLEDAVPRLISFWTP